MKLKFVSLIFLLVLAPLWGVAQLQEEPTDDLTPKYSNEFLAIGIGARALGMSNTFVAQADDVTAAYWNPAGLLEMDSPIQASAMHAEYFAGIANYDYMGVAKKLTDDQAIALSVIRFGVDNILNTTDLIDNEGRVDYDRIELFSAADYAFIFSYAKRTKIEGLAIGGNAKVIYRQVGDFAKSWGFGIDASAKYIWRDWKFAGIARDVTTTFNAWKYSLDETVIETFNETGNEIPENDIELTLPSFSFGGSRSFQFNKVSLETELGLDITTDGERQALVSSSSVSLYPHWGFELGYENTVFLRGGVGNFQYETNFDFSQDLSFQPNIGLGLRIRKLYLNYALSDVGDQSAALYSNVISMRINLDGKK